MPPACARRTGDPTTRIAKTRLHKRIPILQRATTAPGTLHQPGMPHIYSMIQRPAKTFGWSDTYLHDNGSLERTTNTCSEVSDVAADNSVQWS